MSYQLNYHEIISLNPQQMINWCNARKKHLGLSNGKLSKLTGVPESTLDRILSGKNLEFRYSSIQPVVVALVNAHSENQSEYEAPEMNRQFYDDTIEGYKLIVKNDSHVIETLQKANERMEMEIEYLKQANKEKQELLMELAKKIK